jgi:hypothetical protein
MPEAPSWLGSIRSTSANDAFDPALWTTFVFTTLGLEVPILSSLPRHHNNQLAKCTAWTFTTTTPAPALPTVCVYYCRTYYKAVFGGGGGQ